jgi:hypothetical protein
MQSIPVPPTRVRTRICDSEVPISRICLLLSNCCLVVENTHCVTSPTISQILLTTTRTNHQQLCQWTLSGGHKALCWDASILHIIFWIFFECFRTPTAQLNETSMSLASDHELIQRIPQIVFYSVSDRSSISP